MPQEDIKDMEDFISGFDNRMHRIFDERNVNLGIYAARMQEIVGKLRNGLRESIREDIIGEIRRYGLGGNTRTAARQGRTLGMQEEGRNGDSGFAYRLHTYGGGFGGRFGGGFHRLPIDWRFPNGTLLDVWLAFMRGDKVNHVPPLRTLQAIDVRHLDRLPLAEEEKAWRLARKILSDLKVVCWYVNALAADQAISPDGLSRTELVQVFERVITTENGLLATNARRSHIKWQSAAKTARKKVKQLAAQNNQ